MLMVVVAVLLSELTKAAALPRPRVPADGDVRAGRDASLIMMNLRVAKFGKLRGLLGWYAALAVTGFVTFVGVAAVIEMVYHIQLKRRARIDAELHGGRARHEERGELGRRRRDRRVGLIPFELMRRRFAHRWGEVQGEIEAAIRAREAA